MFLNVILFFFSLLKGMNPEESMVYFSPTGEYFPAKNWPKVMASTSGKSKTRESNRQKRSRRATRESKYSNLGDEEARDALRQAVAEVRPKSLVYKIGNNRLKLTVFDEQEAKKLVESFKKLGFASIKLKKKEGVEKNETEQSNSNPSETPERKSFRIILRKKKAR